MILVQQVHTFQGRSTRVRNVNQGKQNKKDTQRHIFDPKLIQGPVLSIIQCRGLSIPCTCFSQSLSAADCSWASTFKKFRVKEHDLRHYVAYGDQGYNPLYLFVFLKLCCRPTKKLGVTSPSSSFLSQTVPGCCKKVRNTGLGSSFCLFCGVINSCDVTRAGTPLP